MTVTTATKELSKLEKMRQRLQQKLEASAANDIERQLKQTDQDIERQKQLVYEAERDAALKDLAKLRGEEMAIVARFVEHLAKFEAIQQDAAKLAAEFSRVAGPYRRGEDIQLAKTNIDIMHHVSSTSFGYTEQGKAFEKYYDKRVSSFTKYDS